MVVERNMKPELRKKNKQYTIYDLQMDGFVLSVTYLNPGESTTGHQHEWNEGYYIASGIGRIMLNDDEVLISGGQLIAVPPNTYHRVFNDGINTLIFVCAFRGENGVSERLK